MDASKDTLLRKADALLGEARRFRKLADAQVSETEREPLLHQARELERRAAILEKDAAGAKNGSIGLGRPVIGLRVGT